MTASTISVLDHGAKGDGRTDDAPAIQRCLDEHPDKVVFLPQRRPKMEPDYFCGRTLELRGPSQVLSGQGFGWGAGTVLKFPPRVSGIMTHNGVCPGACIRDLALIGSEPWSGIRASEAVLPAGFGGGPDASDADGVRIGANFIRCENVYVGDFGRHGFHVGDAQAPGTGLMADNVRIVNCYAFNNRGSGIHFQGGDSNACTTWQFVGNVNQLWGICDVSFLGNTHIAPQTHANHSSLWAPPKEREEIERIWKEAGAEGGPYRGSDTPNWGNVYIGPYAESDQPPPKFSWKDVVIGGTIGSSDPHLHLNTSENNWNAWNVPFLSMTSGKDRVGIVTLKAGETAGQDIHIVARNLDGSAAWSVLYGVFSGEWSLWEGEVGKGEPRLRFPRNGPPTIDGKPVAAGGTPGPQGPPGPVGPQGPPGPAGPAMSKPKRVEAIAIIPKGKTSVVVEHDLGGQPHPEDVGDPIVDGTAIVKFAGATDKTLSYKTDVRAKADIRFTYTARLWPQ